MKEKELIAKCKKLDDFACKYLYDQNADWLYAICRRYARDEDAAKDILQDAFIRIFDKIGTYKGEGSLRGWMKAVTVNVALRACQKLNSKPDQVRWEDHHDNVHIDANLLESIDVEELKHFINSLPEGRRQVFNAFVIEGYSHKEIAEEMGISEGTSKSQLFDAKKELKQFIEKQSVIVKNISL